MTPAYALLPGQLRIEQLVSLTDQSKFRGLASRRPAPKSSDWEFCAHCGERLEAPEIGYAEDMVTQQNLDPSCWACICHRLRELDRILRASKDLPPA